MVQTSPIAVIIEIDIRDFSSAAVPAKYEPPLFIHADGMPPRKRAFRQDGLLYAP
jgi:hypothetical protein